MSAGMGPYQNSGIDAGRKIAAAKNRIAWALSSETTGNTNTSTPTSSSPRATTILLAGGMMRRMAAKNTSIAASAPSQSSQPGIEVTSSTRRF